MNSKNIPSYAEREMIILDYLGKHDIASIDEICKLLSASPATVRRDFTAMSNNGLIIRSRGYVKLANKSPLTPVAQSTIIDNKIDEEKSIIAKYAASFVNAGDYVFIGAGKTCNFFAKYIKDVEKLTVITTNITVVLELISCPNISLILLGGEVHAGTNFIETTSLSFELEKEFESLYFDKVFITVDGIEFNSGYTIRNHMLLPLYSKLINTSREFFLFADSYKFGNRAFVPVYGMDQINNIITTDKIPKAYLDYYRSHNKTLYLA